MSYSNSKSALERAIYAARNSKPMTDATTKLISAAEDFLREAESETGDLERKVRREKKRARE